MSEKNDNLLIIKNNLEKVHSQIARHCEAAKRPVKAVKLLAVSKKKPIESIVSAYECGQRAFGENYVQEGVDKIQALSHYPEITWYFIGALQSNKAKWVAEHFDWVLTVDREKIAQRLSDNRPEHLPPLNLCIQINISEEDSKSGISLETLESLADKVSALPNVALRGVMAIPNPKLSIDVLNDQYEALRQAFEQLKGKYPDWDTLSIGMSADLEMAINAGSTLVRVGAAIFGAREQ